MVAVHTKAIRHCFRLQYITIGNNVALLATHLHVAMFFFFKREESNVLFGKWLKIWRVFATSQVITIAKKSLSVVLFIL